MHKIDNVAGSGGVLYQGIGLGCSIWNRHVDMPQGVGAGACTGENGAVLQSDSDSVSGECCNAAGIAKFSD